MIPYYGEDNSGFGQAFQNQFKRSLGIPGEPPVGGGGGPMPVPDGGPGWRSQNWIKADRFGNTGQVTSDGNGNTSAVTRGDVWGGSGPAPTMGGDQSVSLTPYTGPRWNPSGVGGDQPVGGGGGPMPVPGDGPNWKHPGYIKFGAPNPYSPPANDLATGGGGGPMPVPTGGPNWRTPGPVGDQPTGGGGGPMPLPPPWVRFGGKPEDYGVTMEFGGPGAINPPGMGPDQLRNLYNPPAPPPTAPNPQASPSPNWGTGFNGGGLAAGLDPRFGAGHFGGGFAPKRGGLGGQDNAPPPPMARPFGGPALPKRGGLGGQDNAPPPPAANPGMGGGAQRLGSPFQFNPQPKEGGWNWGDMSNIYRRRF